MRIAVGADHAGYSMRPVIIEAIESAGHIVVDFGAFDATPGDYPDYALLVGRAIQKGDADRGVSYSAAVASASASPPTNLTASAPASAMTSIHPIKPSSMMT